MKTLTLLFGVCLVIQLFNNAQAYPHRSIEDTEEDDTSSETESVIGPAIIVHVTAPEPEPNMRDMSSHETKSHEDEDSSEEETEPNQSDEDDAVKFPKLARGDHAGASSQEAVAASDHAIRTRSVNTESLCPARPEEITNIELECAKEYQLWKELRAKKDITTTCDPVQMLDSNHTGHVANTTEDTNEDMQMSTQELTTQDMTTTQEMTTEEETTTEMMTTTMTTTTTTTTRKPTTTTPPMRRSNNNNSGRKHKRSVKRKRSCYPATCMLKKLNLLDTMGQPSIKQIQKFAVNMTVDDSMNLEEKAVECVKEINEAMIDASTDIGKKVGCVAQKVITCLNKGLTCPIMKVPQ